MTVLGIGLDVVDVPGFASHLDEPGNGLRRLFSERELRQVRIRARLKGDTEVVHLAARWAAKEAVQKAWSAALGERSVPYTVDSFPWAQIEILSDGRGRPQVFLRDAPRAKLYNSLELTDPTRGGAPTAESIPGQLVWHVSLSHDGTTAAAYVLLEYRPG